MEFSLVRSFLRSVGLDLDLESCEYFPAFYDAAEAGLSALTDDRRLSLAAAARSECDDDGEVDPDLVDDLPWWPDFAEVALPSGL